jgi:peroxiredoxin
MPQTLSRPIQLGATAPAFRLPEPRSGKEVSLADFAGKPVLVAFISNVCPSVKLIAKQFNQFAKDYAGRLQVIGINSNAAEIKAGETSEGVAEEARAQGYVFPYLRDESQQVAEAYDAACTPDFFLYDAQGKLFYHGQFDDARPNNGIEPTGADLRAAVDAVLAGQAAPATQKQAIGCNIKWRDGDDHGVRQAGQAVAA